MGAFDNDGFGTRSLPLFENVHSTGFCAYACGARVFVDIHTTYGLIEVHLYEESITQLITHARACSVIALKTGLNTECIKNFFPVEFTE